MRILRAYRIPESFTDLFGERRRDYDPHEIQVVIRLTTDEWRQLRDAMGIGDHPVEEPRAHRALPTGPIEGELIDDGDDENARRRNR